MKRNLFKLFMFMSVAVTTTAVAQQKESKTFTEKFNVNKDVVVAINANNAEIDVTTWNKNQVEVVATIEIEGLTKKEAEKYLNNWKFEALANKDKVSITANGSNSFHFGNNFVVFNEESFPKFVMPKMPEIKIPEIHEIDIPEIDFDVMFLELDKLEFDFDKYQKEGKNYFFQWKDSANNITIKSKKDWEKFKKSKEYKKWQEELKNQKVKIFKELEKAKLEYKKVDKEKIRKAIEEARKSIEKVDMEKLKKEMDEAKKKMKEVKYEYLFDSANGEIEINGKKIKVTKRISIKVPKGATFDLNTRHSKVKLPKGKTTGKMSYGSLDAETIEGGNLNVFFSKVMISDITGGKLQLNNVTDATIASVTNSTIFTTSGDLKVGEVMKNVEISTSFGSVFVEKLHSSYQPFKLTLKQSQGTINLQGLAKKFNFEKSAKTTSLYGKPSISKQDKNTYASGSFLAQSTDKSITIESKLSQLTLTNK